MSQHDQSTANPDGRLPRIAYKINEVAEICGVHHASIRRAIERGDLKACRKFRHALIPVDEVKRFLKGGE